MHARAPLRASRLLNTARGCLRRIGMWRCLDVLPVTRTCLGISDKLSPAKDLTPRQADRFSRLEDIIGVQALVLSDPVSNRPMIQHISTIRTKSSQALFFLKPKRARRAEHITTIAG